MSADPALVAEFANEVSEHLDASEQILVAASVEAPSPDDINLLFRSFHSIKGLARVIAFGPLEGIAHEAESLLATVRSGAQPLSEAATNLLLQSLDVIKQARTDLVEGRTFAGNDKLIAALKAATKGGGGAGPVADSAPSEGEEAAATFLHADLYFDEDTLVAQAELFDELLPGIATSVLEPESISPAQLKEDFDVLLFALDKIRLQSLADALQALASERAPLPFARFLRLLDGFRSLLTQSCGYAEVVLTLRGWFTEALQGLLAQQRPQDGLDLLAILMPGTPFGVLLPQLVQSGLEPEERDDFLRLCTEAIQTDLASDASSASPLSLMLADRIRERLQREFRPPQPLLRFLESRKLDPERFARVSPALNERLAQMQQAKGSDFFEVLIEQPPQKAALLAFAEKAAAALEPILCERATIEGMQSLAILIFGAADEEQLRAKVTDCFANPDLLILRKLDGRQTTSHFGIKAKPAATAAQGGGVQVRVPVELMDAMFGRIGQFFSVSARFNAMVHDSEGPDILRELSDYSVLHAPHLLPKIDWLIRQQNDFATLEAESHRLITLIHETTLGLRVIPLDTLFSRFPRMVRDLAQKQKKLLRFDARAKGIRVDNGMVELLADPLMHMLRNSVDHGLETPEERLAAGKPRTAALILSAEQRGNRIVVEINDDGRGINIEKVRLKAVASDLVSDEESRKLSDEQIARFIFTPGFSTADKITDTSGRGVGMDVALVNVTKLGGKIDIQTRPGLGTTFRLDMPLSKAIQPMLLAETGVQTVALPDRMIVEGTVVSAAELQNVNGQRSILLHGRFLPIFKLVELLRLPEPPPQTSDQLSIVVCDFNGRRIGIEVHKIMRRADMLIQEMHPRIAHLPGIGGISTLGTDRIVVVIDPEGLFELAKRHTVFGLRAHSVRLEEGLV
jgi:chemotaxis protein histidine kinase CheA